jgi:hypothetical protein
MYGEVLNVVNQNARSFTDEKVFFLNFANSISLWYRQMIPENCYTVRVGMPKAYLK